MDGWPIFAGMAGFFSKLLSKTTYFFFCKMKILFYVEPVVFRGNPLFLAPHIKGWILPMIQTRPDWSWNLASSPSLCDLALSSSRNLQTYPIPSWEILAPFSYYREAYSNALFDPVIATAAISSKGPLAALAAHLQALNQACQPDLVIATSQNCLLKLAFPSARCLWIEQAPLPRRQRCSRIYFDPCGHQVGSTLEKATCRIRALAVNPVFDADIFQIWQAMSTPQESDLANAEKVQRAISCRAGDNQVALLALQPADWLTWEGSLGHAYSAEAVLTQWAAGLPEGWVGIPLHHPDFCLPMELEESIAAEFPQLRPLPLELSRNVAEWALPVADAVVTVSSSLAGQALLAGKQVVICGQSPLRNFASTDLSALATPGPSMAPREQLALLAFLSNRYTLTLSEIADPAGPLPDHLKALHEAADPVSWLLDLSAWTPERLARLV